MISVLLPYRNAEATLREALESVLADLDEDDEVVTIDDGSTDRSAELAAATRDPRVRHVASHGRGIVSALNAGVAAARGDLLARMDADDLSLPGRFASSRALLRADRSLAVAAVGVSLFGQVTAGMQRYVDWQNALVTAADHSRELFVESPLCHPASTIRRSALDAVGGYREASWAEDYDLWLRLSAAGFGLAKDPRLLFRWRVHPSSLTWTDPRYAPASLCRARASHLAASLRARDCTGFAIWGAGKTGRRLGRALEEAGASPAFFVDIDPRKVGRTARGAPILAPGEGLARLHEARVFLVVAVGAPGAREIVRGRLTRAGLQEGERWLAAA